MHAFQEYTAEEKQPRCGHLRWGKCQDMLLWENIYLSKRLRSSDWLPPNHSLNISLFYASAGHSPAVPLVFPCNLFISTLCGLSSTGTQLFPAHPEPASLAAGTLSECVMCQQVRYWNAVDQDNPSLGSLLGPHHQHDNETGCRQVFLYWLHLQGSACSVPQDKGTLVNLSVYKWQTLNRKAFWQSLSHALACYGTCSHFSSWASFFWAV